MAFDALMHRYSREDLVVIMYHLHIPAPDPMANPSTEARAENCGVGSTPSYAIDGKMEVGGGGSEEAENFYKKLNSRIEERLTEKPEARIALRASRQDGVIQANVMVDKVSSSSPDLRLHLALVEKSLTYSGQGSLRFHPMVVRSLGGEKAAGYALNRSGKTTVAHSFDLEKISRDLKAYLDNCESERKMLFSHKKYRIDGERLSVAAFVQDAKTSKILQAAFVGLPAAI